MYTLQVPGRAHQRAQGPGSEPVLVLVLEAHIGSPHGPGYFVDTASGACRTLNEAIGKALRLADPVREAEHSAAMLERAGYQVHEHRLWITAEPAVYCPVEATDRAEIARTDPWRHYALLAALLLCATLLVYGCHTALWAIGGGQ